MNECRLHKRMERILKDKQESRKSEVWFSRRSECLRELSEPHDTAASGLRPILCQLANIGAALLTSCQFIDRRGQYDYIESMSENSPNVISVVAPRGLYPPWPASKGKWSEQDRCRFKKNLRGKTRYR